MTTSAHLPLHNFLIASGKGLPSTGGVTQAWGCSSLFMLRSSLPALPASGLISSPPLKFAYNDSPTSSKVAILQRPWKGESVRIGLAGGVTRTSAVDTSRK